MQCRSKGRGRGGCPPSFFPKSKNRPVQTMGYDTFRLDIADLEFFQSLGNARKLLLSEICTLGKLIFVIQLPMPSTSAPSPLRPTCVQPRERAGSTTSCISTRNWRIVLTWWRLPICLWGTTSSASTWAVWEVFKKRPSDEVYLCL